MRSPCKCLFGSEGLPTDNSFSVKFTSSYHILSQNIFFLSHTVKNLFNEIEVTLKFVCYRRISLQPIKKKTQNTEGTQ